MPALPLPILTFLFCLVACVLVWRLDLGNRLARTLFTAVFGLIATATLLIGLRFGYGFEKLIVIQRVIPLFIGPTIYLGFLSLTRSPAEIRPKARVRSGNRRKLPLLRRLAHSALETRPRQPHPRLSGSGQRAPALDAFRRRNTPGDAGF